MRLRVCPFGDKGSAEYRCHSVHLYCAVFFMLQHTQSIGVAGKTEVQVVQMVPGKCLSSAEVSGLL